MCPDTCMAASGATTAINVINASLFKVKKKHRIEVTVKHRIEVIVNTELQSL